jgi:uncharacterized protein involved in exopolysaccharide biosynthesis
VSQVQETPVAEGGPNWVDLVLLAVSHRWLLMLGPLLAGLAALGISFAIAPSFTARTSFVPPQQAQSAATAALASLGALSGLVGAGGNLRTPADQYVALMQSATITDKLIDDFKLMQVYGEKYRSDAREELAKNVRIAIGKKDGLISIEVDDTDPARAAAIANRHVEELRTLSSQLALTEAQQRRAFFEGQMTQTRKLLEQAQQSLQASGFNASALRAEPKAVAEGYARLKAEISAGDVRLQILRRSLTDSAPEIAQQQALLSSLRGELARLEATDSASAQGDYIGRYREFKYQETLFELLARQFELARLDESREGALIQVVDAATPPEKKSKPRRLRLALAAAGGTLLLLLVGIVIRHAWHLAQAAPETAASAARLRALWRGA